MKYNTELFREQDAEGTIFWVARHPALSGCMSQGFSPDEALSGLEEARQLYLDALARYDQPLPAEEAGMLVHYGGIRVYP